jgi:hypothetical protein
MRLMKLNILAVWGNLLSSFAVVKPNGFLISIKRNRLAFLSVQAELFSRAPLMQAVQINMKPVAIVNTFNGHKKLEIIDIAQGGNMLKNSKHFVFIINEERTKAQDGCLEALQNGSKSHSTRNHQACRAECGQSNNTKTRQGASSPRNSSSS